MALTAIAAALVAGCATVPTGPYVAALPGSRTTPQQFAADDSTCRVRAQAYFGPASTQPANDAAAANVVAGTLIGAAIGALFGAAVGDPGTGAAIGAGTGLLGGSAVAADTSGYSSAQLQATYDRVYLQCMYSFGHRVPQSAVATRTYRYPAPPGAVAPPAGTPPPARRYAPPTTAPPPAGFPPPDAPPPSTVPSG
jgi:hypothetical protein